MTKRPRFPYLTTKDVDLVLQWCGAATTLAGAVLTAADVYPWNVWFLNLGALLFLVWAVRIRSHSLITVNAGLLAIYAGGTVRSIFVG